MDRDGESCSEGTESEPESNDGSLYIPTPERPRTVVRPILLPNRLCLIELSQLSNFINTVNEIRSCTTPRCKGNLAPVAVKCRGLGGAITVRYSCDGCNLKGATLEAHSKWKPCLRFKHNKCVSAGSIYYSRMYSRNLL